MSFENEIQECLKTLRSGGTILYPTDTIWGIGCDATNEKAAEKVLALKQKAGSKGLIALVSDDSMLNRFVKNVPEQAWELMDACDTEDTKPITIIYDAANGLAKNIPADDGSIGIRMVNHASEGGNDFCHELIRKFGKPIISTSANISGMPAPKNFFEISDAIISGVDYAVKLHTLGSPNRTPSAIIKLKTNGEFLMLRK